MSAMLLENASITKPIKVPNWESNNIGFRPYLSLNDPHIGPENRLKTALVDKSKPICQAGTPNCWLKKGKYGIRTENPRISTNTAIQSGVSSGNLFLSWSLRFNIYTYSYLIYRRSGLSNIIPAIETRSSSPGCKVKSSGGTIPVPVINRTP